jgi:SAM-dependent methyltransferase
MTERDPISDARDLRTADAFAESWNRVPSVYTREQFVDWFHPIKPDDLRGKEVVELGFGNGSLLLHVAQCAPKRLVGIDLGDTIEHTRRNLAGVPVNVELHRGDLTRAQLGSFDLAYCIGVLHHLDEPRAGFEAVLRHTRAGGRFHCWVYAREGNALVRAIVEPVRHVSSRLPWWFTKYGLALPMVFPYFLFAKTLRALRLDGPKSPLRWLPLFGYTRWIAPEPLRFFHHVAFDQLVTPRTAYIPRRTVEEWLSDERVDSKSTYVEFRNGNSWKFGGRTVA